MSTAAAPAPSLWRHGSFLRFWGGQTASQFGEQFGNLAIPVLAVSVLHATEFEVGLLGTLQTLAFLVIGLPAGAWIDRWVKRRVMLRADLARAILLALVPVLWFTGVLQFWQVLVIATAVGVCSVFFDVSYQSFIPLLVKGEQVADANGKLETTAQVARIAGPAGAGGLLAILAAPLILAVTAITYLLSFVALATVRDTETPAPKADRRPLVVEIREGLVWVFRQPLLVRIVLCTAIGNLFTSIAFTMMPVLVLRHLDLGPIVYGAMGAVGAVGGLLGAAFAARVAKWIGEGTAIPVSAVVFAVGLGIQVSAAFFEATPAVAIALIMVGDVLFSASVLVYNITQVSFRQRICPPPLLGRMNASIRFIVWGVMPIGGLLSGLLATWLGLVPAMVIGAIGGLLSAAPVVFSPLLGMRKLPVSAVGAAEDAPPASAFEPGAEPEDAPPTEPLR